MRAEVKGIAFPDVKLSAPRIQTLVIQEAQALGGRNRPQIMLIRRSGHCDHIRS